VPFTSHKICRFYLRRFEFSSIFEENVKKIHNKYVHLEYAHFFKSVTTRVYYSVDHSRVHSMHSLLITCDQNLQPLSYMVKNYLNSLKKL